MNQKWIVSLQIMGGIVFLLIITHLELLTYGLRQAKGQWGIIYNAERVEDLILDREYPDSILNKLMLVQEVKEFAYQYMGLNKTDIYNSINMERGKYIMYVVTGSRPFQLYPYLWKFPVAGEVPYKGFFDLPLALRERNTLEENGWDAGIRTAGGWSTLGWFENPLLAEMLDRETGDFVNLVLHEMAHETIYIPDSSDLNENLATFIGDEGTLRFLATKYGTDSEEYVSYVKSEEDSKVYSEYFIQSTDRLNSLYGSFNEENGLEYKTDQKEDLIRDIVSGLDAIEFKNPEKYRSIFGDRLPNNTYFLSFIRYRSGQDIFYRELKDQYQNDFKKYILHLKIQFGE